MSRLIRLLRLVKVHAKVGELLEQLQTEVVRIAFGIVKLVIMIVLANHCIACGFYWIGTLSQHTLARSWLEEYDMESRSLWYRYSTALHWSLTQFTPASMEIFPRSALERTYTICTLLLALITFSSFISSLTNAMTQLRNLNSETQTQHSLLRRYFRENHVNTDLASRLWAWFQAHSASMKIRLHEKDVPLLSSLPCALQIELWDAVYMKALIVHPLFFQMREHFPAFTRKLNRCMNEISISLERELFQAGDIADSMYFVVVGTLNYYRNAHYLFRSQKTQALSPMQSQGRRIQLSQFEPEAVISRGQWLCEPVLWTMWRHAGSLVAASNSELFAIHADKFRQLLKNQRELLHAAQRYAQLFADHVNQSPGYTTDVSRDFDVLQEAAQRAFSDPVEEVEEENVQLNEIPRDGQLMVLPSSIN